MGCCPREGFPPPPTHMHHLDLPSTMPQGYSRPRTRCPLASTTVLLPITAKGALSWGWAGARAHTQLVWVRGSWLERGVGTQCSVSPSSITINNLFLKGSWHHPAPPPPTPPPPPLTSLLPAGARAGAIYTLGPLTG